MAILKNDFQLTELGYAPKKSKYYSILKRIEIDARVYEGKQLKLFLWTYQKKIKKGIAT